jgi:hypothetical protein
VAAASTAGVDEKQEGEEVLRQGGLHMGKGNSEKGAREVAATF